MNVNTFMSIDTATKASNGGGASEKVMVIAVDGGEGETFPFMLTPPISTSLFSSASGHITTVATLFSRKSNKYSETTGAGGGQQLKNTERKRKTEIYRGRQWI